jgi:hypothetical protein
MKNEIVWSAPWTLAIRFGPTASILKAPMTTNAAAVSQSAIAARGDGSIAELAAEQLAGHRRQQALYEQLLDRYAGRDELAHQLAPLRIGVAYEQEYIDFWQEMAERPDDAGGRGRRRPR